MNPSSAASGLAGLRVDAGTNPVPLACLNSAAMTSKSPANVTVEPEIVVEPPGVIGNAEGVADLSQTLVAPPARPPPPLQLDDEPAVADGPVEREEGSLGWEFAQLRIQIRNDLRAELRAVLREVVPTALGRGDGGKTTAYTRTKTHKEPHAWTRRIPISHIAKAEAEGYGESNESSFNFVESLADSAAQPVISVALTSQPSTTHNELDDEDDQPKELTRPPSPPHSFGRQSPPFSCKSPATNDRLRSVAGRAEQPVDEPPSLEGGDEVGPISKQSGAKFDLISDAISRFDQAMGLVQGSTLDWKLREEVGKNSSARRFGERIVRSKWFETIVILFIMANAIVVGAQTNEMAKVSVSPCAFQPYRELEIVFCIIFALELCLKLFVYQIHFFTMGGYAWNVFDLSIVIVQVMEEILTTSAAHLGLDYSACRNSTGTMLRIVRVLRAVRIVRVLRVMRVHQELRMLVGCVLNSSKSFLWALLLIWLMVYVLSVYVVQLITTARHDQPDEDFAELERWFGSVSRAMLSLFQALTGGVDWDDLVRPLGERIGAWVLILVTAYIAFFVLAVLNVVTGTFVESAIDRAKELREVNLAHRARRIFTSLDNDMSGTITLSEVKHHLTVECNAELVEYFKQIDVDVSEAECLFDMLDINDSGSIDLEEFLSGCLRMQGSAKSLDLLLVTREARYNDERTTESLDRMEAKLREIRNQVFLSEPHRDVLT